METPTKEKSNPSLESSKIEKPMINIKKQDKKKSLSYTSPLRQTPFSHSSRTR